MALTERTRKFVMEITSNGVPPEAAAKLAGLPVSAVPAMLENPAIRRAIDIALGNAGINEEYFSTKLKELCEATNSKSQPDWSARAKGLTLLKDIFGHDAPKKVEQTTTVVTYEERLLLIADQEAVINTDLIKEIACN